MATCYALKSVDVYSARISPSGRIAEGVSYETLVERVREFTVRAAFARVADQQTWEEDELRRKGLRALELFHNGRAIWHDRLCFEEALAQERSAGMGASFEAANELDPDFCERLDRELRERWRRVGYLVPSLALDMKPLFTELEADAADTAREARDDLLAELLAPSASGENCPEQGVGEGPIPNP